MPPLTIVGYMFSGRPSGRLFPINTYFAWVPDVSHLNLRNPAFRTRRFLRGV